MKVKTSTRAGLGPQPEPPDMPGIRLIRSIFFR